MDDRYTITVYTNDGHQVFNGCSEVRANESSLTFMDTNGKQHEFYGVEYHIAQQ